MNNRQVGYLHLLLLDKYRYVVFFLPSTCMEIKKIVSTFRTFVTRNMCVYIPLPSARKTVTPSDVNVIVHFEIHNTYCNHIWCTIHL